MKALLRSRPLWLSVLAVCGLCTAVALAALFDEDTAVEDVFSHELYASIMAGKVEGIADIVADFECRQLTYLPIVVPNPEYIHVQSGGILPFDPAQSRFPREFLDGLVAVEEGAITKYPITMREHPRTRERIIFNARNERIGGQYARRDYDPQWYLKQQYPGLSEMDPAAARRLIAIYEPSRIVITYDLMLKEDVVRHVFKQSIDAAARAEKGGAGGGGMRSGWEGGPVSNLQFTAIDWETNGTMTVTLAYPTDYSNSTFEIFTVDGPRGLIHSWWDPGTVTNADASTNWISWNDTGIVRSYGDVRYYVAAVSNDWDGDGASDGFETYVSHTGDTNSNSYPVCVSGTISYGGILSGPVRMVAVTASNEWVGAMVSIPSPSAYVNDRVGVGTSYWFKAYRDSDDDRLCDYWEAQGAYASNPVDVTHDVSGVNISLSNPEDDNDADDLPDWWEMHYFGDLDEGPGDDEPDSDGLVNSNEYAEGTDPTDGDTDDDGMGDWAELVNGEDPIESGSYATLPFVEAFDVLEYTNLVGNANSTNFGHSLAVDSNTMIVGAYDPDSVNNCAAYVYDWNGTSWQPQTVLSAPAGATCFGVSVDVHGDRAVVGAHREGNKGAVHIYERSGTNWSHVATLTASDGDDNDHFGHAVAVYDETVLVGAYRNNYNDGSAYVFTGSGSTWQQCTNMYGTYPCRMGRAVDISDTRLVVGADGWNGDNRSWQGQAYVYAWDGTNAVLEDRVCSDVPERRAAYGCSVAIDGDTLAVGSKGYQYDSDAYGAAYVYTWDGVSWTNEQMLLAPDHQDFDYFGVSVALEGGRLLVGAYGDDDVGADSGSAYLYLLDETWQPCSKFAPNELNGEAGFGRAVACAADRVVTGAPGQSNGGRTGCLYSFSLSNIVNSAGHQYCMPIDGVNGWVAYPSAFSVVQDQIYRNGTGALETTNSFGVVKLHQLIAANGADTGWSDCWAKMSPTNVSLLVEHPDLNQYPEWLPTVFAVNGEAQLIAYDGSEETWCIASNVTVTTDFHRYTVKQNYSDREWDLYFDGSNVLSNLGFRDSGIAEFSRFSFKGQWHSFSYLDDVSISTNQPSF